MIAETGLLAVTVASAALAGYYKGRRVNIPPERRYGIEEPPEDVPAGWFR